MAADKPRPAPGPPDPALLLQSMLPGLAWSPSMLDGPLRAQATVAAQTLRQLNAPVVDALRRHRDLADSLASTAAQVAAMAEQIEALSRQHAAVADQLRAAMEPYLRYVDWLAEYGGDRAGRPPPT